MTISSAKLMKLGLELALLRGYSSHGYNSYIFATGFITGFLDFKRASTSTVPDALKVDDTVYEGYKEGRTASAGEHKRVDVTADGAVALFNNYGGEAWLQATRWIE